MKNAIESKLLLSQNNNAFSIEQCSYRGIKPSKGLLHLNLTESLKPTSSLLNTENIPDKHFIDRKSVV